MMIKWLWRMRLALLLADLPFNRRSRCGNEQVRVATFLKNLAGWPGCVRLTVIVDQVYCPIFGYARSGSSMSAFAVCIVPLEGDRGHG